MNKKEIKLINKYYYSKNKIWEKFVWYSGFKNFWDNNYTKKYLINKFKKLEQIKKANKFKLLNVSTKLHKNFWKNTKLDKAYVIENYSFSFKKKSLSSYLMFLAKEESNIMAINHFAESIYKKYLYLNKHFRFEYVWFLESSNKNRKIQIMDIIKEYFIKMEGVNIKLLEINKQNTYLEQKKIFNLEWRIKNACDSFSVWKIDIENCNIILIDDVIDSWATLNSIATKIKKQNKVTKIIWLGCIWSLKGKIKITDI